VAYPVFADFRTLTLAEYCVGLSLSLTEAPDAILTATIARMVKRLEGLTDDEFVTATGRTYDLRGSGTSTLALPARCTAITTVKTRDYLGTLTTQDAAAYRLVSSLDAAGANRVTGQPWDYLEIPAYKYLTGVVLASGWTWPPGAETIQVVGTFGWTVTPADINRAIALMTYDAVKAQAQNLRRADRMETVDAVYTFNPFDPDHPTGINEADEIINSYRRSSGLLVG
jgi:hypothetical protein